MHDVVTWLVTYVCVCMSQVLGCGPADYVTQVQGLQAVKRDAGKTNKSLMDELAQLHGRELARLSAEQGLTCSYSCLTHCTSGKANVQSSRCSSLRCNRLQQSNVTWGFITHFLESEC